MREETGSTCLFPDIQVVTQEALNLRSSCFFLRDDGDLGVWLSNRALAQRVQGHSEHPPKKNKSKKHYKITVHRVEWGAGGMLHFFPSSSSLLCKTEHSLNRFYVNISFLKNKVERAQDFTNIYVKNVLSQTFQCTFSHPQKLALTEMSFLWQRLLSIHYTSKLSF